MTVWHCKSEYSGKDASAAVRRLLGHAFSFQYGAELPRIEKTPEGKPYFPERADVHFSLSHSGGHLLCALGEAPVGCDIQVRRALRPGTAEKLADERERREFDFFELWCLRESLFKLCGASLRTARFRRVDGAVIAPEPGVVCRVLGTAEDCACAVCTLGDAVCAELREVSAAELFGII